MGGGTDGSGSSVGDAAGSCGGAVGLSVTSVVDVGPVVGVPSWALVVGLFLMSELITRVSRSSPIAIAVLHFICS